MNTLLSMILCNGSRQVIHADWVREVLIVGRRQVSFFSHAFLDHLLGLLVET